MPRMLPADIYDGCPSPGEREIFFRLKNSPGIDDWVVLHSLDLAQHVRRVSGEADFVVIAPELGILCLEVKACTHMRRDDNGWWYGNDPKPDPRGPFRQAAEAMHSIRHRIARARPDLSNIVCWSAVIFPYVTLNERSGEWHEWQLIDSQRFRARTLPDLLRSVLVRARAHLQQKGAIWFKASDPRPTVGQVGELAAILRPSFEVFASPKTRAQQVESELKQYTAEQYRGLDAMTTNPRVLFMGPAGTGKTLLAIEAARRAASAGRRVLFVCFNRYLGQWLVDQMSSLAPQVKVSTLHRFMLDISGTPTPPAAPTARFWEVDLPARALGALLEGALANAPYDELIVDEAQDVLRPDYLDVLDMCLRGGLSTGRWRLVGDFEKQSLYVNSTQDPLAALRQRVAAFAEYGLRDNCRNPPRIACLAHLLGRLAPDYGKVLRPDNGIEPEILYYRDADHQRQLVANELESLAKEGLQAHEIVILSSRADQHNIARGLTSPRWQMRPVAEKTARQVGYCSIHAFKGLEARAIIIVDVDDLAPAGTADLFYTGVTRAIERLIILANQAARSSIISALLRRHTGD
jgi:DNA polymerase III delta prime subunit